MALPAPTEPTAVPPGARYHGLRVTPAEYELLEDDGYQYDMIDGVLYMTPGPNFEHGERATAFVFELKLYLKTNPRGKVLESRLLAGFKIHAGELFA